MFKRFYTFLFLFSFLTAILFSTQDSNFLFSYPIKNNNVISSKYGMRVLFNRYHFHNGIDIPAVTGTPIHSLDSGIITYIGFDKNGYGVFLIILHQNGYKSLYGHLSERLIVKLGDYIIKNQVISYVGPTILSNGQRNGATTGAHLHFTVFDEKGNTLDPLSLEYEKE